MHPWEFDNAVVKSLENSEFPDETARSSVLKRLGAGNVMKKFSGTSRRTKSEDRTFYVKLDTRQIIWSKTQVLEGYIDIREIKEVRQGKDSVDFERLQDESRRVDSTLCFSIFYGNEFNLKVMSVAAQNPQDADVWIRGLNYLAYETLKAPYPLRVKWWLRKEFDQICHKEQVNLKAAKAWLPNVNAKSLSSKTLKELFHEVDTRRKGWIVFDQFVKFYYDVMFNAQEQISEFIMEFSEDKISFSVRDLQKFLIREQKETWAEDICQVKTFLSQFHGFSDFRVEPLSNAEMVAYLFSKENSIWDQKKLRIDEETLKKPMSQYWISSSHNTYLTGDQLRSESSCEAYARCLRMGCRCIELDCWDGANGMPCICHGHTLTTKVPFFDVLKTIKKHAFIVSDLPLILSIENHCSLKQQKHMAAMFQDVFGDMLCTKPVTKDESLLPSPLDLKRKIIVKHKKLADRNRQSEVFNGDFDSLDNLDVSLSVKNGLMYLYEPTLKEWNLHYFVLTEGILVFTEEQRPKIAELPPPYPETQGLIAAELQEPQFDTSYTPKTIDVTELHRFAKWYHGNIDRQAALRLIGDYGNREASFLVRDSRKMEGGYTLSFVNRGQIQHCVINPEFSKGHIHFYIFKQVYFESLYSLVAHYQSHPMENRDMGLQIILGDPVPPPNFHERMEWFHNDIDRNMAESILRNIPKDGAFLVRNGRNPGQFAISFRAGSDIKHCKITMEEQLYFVGSAPFETLVDCVNFYQRKPLFRKIFLSWPVTKEFLSKMSTSTPPNADQPLRVRAKYDYVKQRNDELSFCKGDIISNVVKEDESWWRGDLGSQTLAFFPSNYVEELPPGVTSDLSRENVDNVLGEMQKGAIDLSNCIMELMPESKGHQNFCFRIKTTFSNQIYELATDTKEDLHDWMNQIKAEIDKKDDEAKIKNRNEKLKHIAVELSDLVMYCRPVPFQEDMRRIYSRPAHEMSSFPETKAMQYASKDKCQTFISYNQRQFSRTYPKGTRVDSSNYNPVPLWNVGSQLVALNFQTCDRPMQINEAKFELNGRCGFIPKPTIFDDTKFNPFLKSNHDNVDPLVINLQIIGARHLPKSSLSSPFIEIEIIGCDYDNKKVKTSKKECNVVSLLFLDSFDFTVHNSALAFLRFSVQDQDMFGDPKFLAHATIPVSAIKPGFRSVLLKNDYSEDIELAALLVHIDIRSLKKEDEEKLEVLEQLKDMNRDFQQKLVTNDPTTPRYKQLQVQQIELQKKIYSMEMELKNKNRRIQ